MYALNKCLVPACRNLSVSSFDKNGNITEKRSYCLDHNPYPGKIQQDIYNYINTHDKIIGLNAAGITFTGIDFRNKKFYGCNFMQATFTHINSEQFLSRMSIFDFAVFIDCSLLKCNVQFSSFSGCKFFHTLFTGSDMIQNNFNGISAFQSSFDDTDLYNSRFIKAKLINTSFRNCNLKKTIFLGIEQENISFKMSNTREAIFDKKGKALFLGEKENFFSEQEV